MNKHHVVHVIANPVRGWNVAQNGRIISTHRTQATAVNAGRRRARRAQVDLVTHGRDGKIRSKDSYGNESLARDSEH
jgi:hypothetical protein